MQCLAIRSGHQAQIPSSTDRCIEELKACPATTTQLVERTSGDTVEAGLGVDLHVNGGS